MWLSSGVTRHCHPWWDLSWVAVCTRSNKRILITLFHACFGFVCLAAPSHCILNYLACVTRLSLGFAVMTCTSAVMPVLFCRLIWALMPMFVVVYEALHNSLCLPVQKGLHVQINWFVLTLHTSLKIDHQIRILSIHGACWHSAYTFSLRILSCTKEDRQFIYEWSLSKPFFGSLHVISGVRSLDTTKHNPNKDTIWQVFNWGC